MNTKYLISLILIISIKLSYCQIDLEKFDDKNNLCNYKNITNDSIAITYFDKKNKGKSIENYDGISCLINGKRYDFLSHLVKNYNPDLSYLLWFLKTQDIMWDLSSQGCRKTNYYKTDNDKKRMVRVAKLALEKGFDLEDKHWVRAVTNNDLELIQLYFEKNRSSLAKKVLDEMVSEAAVHHNIDILSFLLDNGGDPNGNSDGMYHIFRAVSNIDTFNLLIERKAKMHPIGYGGSTIVHAAREGCLDVIRILMKNGADPKMVYDGSKLSAIKMAKKYNKHNSSEVLKLFKSKK